MRIGIDLDEVLAGYLPKAIECYNSLHKTSWSTNDFALYKFGDVWGLTKEKVGEFIVAFHSSPFFQQIEPIEGAIKAIKLLATEHKLFVITSRQADIQQATIDWVNTYFPDLFQGIYFTHCTNQEISQVKKSAICDELGIEILIEDYPAYLIECVKPNRILITFDYPWNRNYNLPESVIRVKGWTEALSIIKQLPKNEAS